MIEKWRPKTPRVVRDARGLEFFRPADVLRLLARANLEFEAAAARERAKDARIAELEAAWAERDSMVTCADELYENCKRERDEALARAEKAEAMLETLLDSLAAARCEVKP